MTKEEAKTIAREFAECEAEKQHPDERLRAILVSALALGFLGGWEYARKGEKVA